MRSVGTRVPTYDGSEAMSTTSTRYFSYDGAVFRGPEFMVDFERWTGKDWQPASENLFTSEEEFLHLREITAAQAEGAGAATAADLKAQALLGKVDEQGDILWSGSPSSMHQASGA